MDEELFQEVAKFICAFHCTCHVDIAYKFLLHLTNHLFLCSVDYMPHKQALHLPSMLTAKAIYDRMQLDLVHTISQAQFYKLWTQHFPIVTIPAVSTI